MENNLENKAKFLLHCYADDLSSIKNIKVKGVVFGILNIINNPADYYAQKKPLSSITDEDAIDLARISLYHPTIEGYCADDVWIGESDLNPNGDHWLEVGMRCWEGSLIINDQTGSIFLKDEDDNHEPIHNVMGTIDFLRSKGYVLPFMGLSVETLIEYGWVKLTE